MVFIIVLLPFLLALISIIFSSIVRNRKREKEITKYDKEVFTKNDLFEYHLSNEVWVGMKILVKCYNKMYILTSIDFSNYDPWYLWKPYRRLSKEVCSKEYCFERGNECFLGNNGKPVLEENRNIFFCLVRGNNFLHKNIKDGNIVGIDPARFPSLGNTVADTELVLWEVINKKDETYELSRTDGRHKFVKDEDIFGVVCYSWVINNGN